MVEQLNPFSKNCLTCINRTYINDKELGRNKQKIPTFTFICFFSSTPEKMNCLLSTWSEWGPYSTPCGVSGTQRSSRHVIVMEKYGGTCTNTLRKTRACPQLSSCLNGGSMQHGTCSCTENYSGSCCQIAGK